MNTTTVNEHRITPNDTLKRISWGAIIGGVTVALVAQLGFGILGMGIGASTIDPLTDANPTAGIGTGAGIWLVVTSLISLFLGGLVSGRLAGVPRQTDGILHGVLTFAVSTLIAFYLITSTIRGLLSGAAGVLGKGLSLTGQGIAAVAPQATEFAKNQLGEVSGIDVSFLQNEAKTILQQTRKPELQPQNIANQADAAKNDVSGGAQNSANNPQAVDEEFNSIFQRVFNRAETTINAADKEALVNIIVARTTMSREEAVATVDRWEATYQRAITEMKKAKELAVQKAKEAADATAAAVSKAALWTFFIMLLSLASAALGGKVGTPSEVSRRLV